MADKFGLNGEVRELKIGRTFEKNSASSQSSSFHTVRYDFKPASVDSTRDGVLHVDENHSVSITVPHMQGNGTTNFRQVSSWGFGQAGGCSVLATLAGTSNRVVLVLIQCHPCKGIDPFYPKTNFLRQQPSTTFMHFNETCPAFSGWGA